MNSSSNEHTVVIPTLNYPKVARCIQTLHETTPEAKIIVVNQGNPDRLKEVRHLIHILVNAYRPLGFAKACNTGWKLCTSPYVTICNDDVEFVNQAWWPAIKEEFQDPRVVGANPKSARQYTIGVNVGDKLPYKEHWTEEDYRAMLALPYTTLQCQAMFCTTFRQDIAQKIGYFDEFFYPGGGEDIDWIVRAKGLRESANRFRGYEVISTPNSYVWHWWNQSNQDPTFVKARVQIRQKYGPDFGMDTATTRKIIRKPLITPL